MGHNSTLVVGMGEVLPQGKEAAPAWGHCGHLLWPDCFLMDVILPSLSEDTTHVVSELNWPPSLSLPLALLWVPGTNVVTVLPLQPVALLPLCRSLQQSPLLNTSAACVLHCHLPQ